MTAKADHEKVFSHSIKEGAMNATDNKLANKPAKPATGKRARKSDEIAIAADDNNVHSEEVRSGKQTSDDNAATKSQSGFDKTVVSKATELATKTSKSASAASTEGVLLTEAQMLKMGEEIFLLTR